MKILINITNHAQEQFPKEQKEYNENNYDKVIDLLSTTIEKNHHEEDIVVLAEGYRRSVSQIVEAHLELYKYPVDLYVDVSVCGEWGLTYTLVNELKALSKSYQKVTYNRVYMDVVYPSTPRVENGNGKTVYQFYKYRRYL